MYFPAAQVIQLSLSIPKQVKHPLLQAVHAPLFK